MGSNDMPELGSRISLISKSDIRYEGKLYTVDPQECTISLANVRSFGTEDRETLRPVPAQDLVYDYILFRATDIKDISVIPTPHPHLLFDPAIVQLSAPPSIGGSRVYPSQGSQQQQQGGGGGGSSFHPVLGHIGSNYSSGFNAMQSSIAPPRPAPPSELQASPTTNDLLTGSRSSTPGLRKVSPTVDQGIQANTRKLSSPPKDKHRNQQQMNRGVGQQISMQQRNMQKQQRTTRDMSYQGGYNMQHQQQGGQRWPMNRGGGGRLNQMRGNRGGSGRNFPRPPITKKQPLKFDADYDFDKANTEFEELRTQLAKVKIGEGEPAAPAPAQNGEEKKDDSGNETAIGEGDHEENEVFYDKTKSFFDNISCEAIERSKGRSQRTDWRKERKLNSETFGVSMARRQAGYRGGRGGGYYQRGGYYQQNRGGGFRSSGYRQVSKGLRMQETQAVKLEVAKA